jgi:glycosyltransferase involved in cell wall biosynthesis
MRIGMVLTSDFPPDPRVEKEAISLTNAGFEVSILCLKFDKKINNENYKGIHIVREFMPLEFHKKLSALVITIPFYRWFWRNKINNFIVSNKIDVIHIHDLPLCGEGIRAAKKMNLSLVGDMHENYPELIKVQKFSNTIAGKLLISKKKWYRKEKKWLNQIDNIVCVESEMKNRMQKFAPNKNFYIVPNTINYNYIMSRQEKNKKIVDKEFGEFNLFYYGKIDDLRGIDTLLKSIQLLKTTIPKIHAIIVGSGISINEYKKLSRELDIENNVSFEGWKPDNILINYMDKVDIGILPQKKTVQSDNSSPNKLYTYMAFSKPVISSNCNSIERIINECQCGLIYESGNYTDLAKKILEMYNNNELTIKSSHNSIMAVKEKYDWDITVQPLLDLYKNIEKK